MVDVGLKLGARNAPVVVAVGAAAGVSEKNMGGRIGVEVANELELSNRVADWPGENIANGTGEANQFSVNAVLKFEVEPALRSNGESGVGENKLPK